ncbi:2Fe-2S iron-sulfur cluster-binding protein [Pseudomonas sp.]|uniref:2Fe-2S iron-sulfur cluster-binding protein n=1 Tax=Pseudomonas sp. TaxID=306 RepID=UPI0031B57936
MPTIIYKRPVNGQITEVSAEAGDSVMVAALKGGVLGITGECGGVLSCATCHVYVDPDWVDRVGQPSDDELDMLDAVNSPRMENSRLCCQIEIYDDLDGLIVQIPEEQ